jgi:hypothetical protein
MYTPCTVVHLQKRSVRSTHNSSRAGLTSNVRAMRISTAQHHLRKTAAATYSRSDQLSSSEKLLVTQQLADTASRTSSWRSWQVCSLKASCRRGVQSLLCNADLLPCHLCRKMGCMPPPPCRWCWVWPLRCTCPSCCCASNPRRHQEWQCACLHR